MLLYYTFLIMITLCNADVVVLNAPKLDSWDLNGEDCGGSNWHLQKKWSKCGTNTSTNDCNLTTPVWKTQQANRVSIYITLGITNTNLTVLAYAEDKTFLGSYVVSSSLNPNDSSVHTDIISIDNMSKRNGIYLDFVRTNTFCGTIILVEVSYHECPRASGELVNFDKAPAPDYITKTTEIFGNCTNNAVLFGNKRPYMKCSFDGTFKVFGECICDAGYTKNGKVCRACPSGQYKADEGTKTCDICGINSKVGVVPRTTCECKTGYYKPIRQTHILEAKCHEPPGAPSNVAVSNITSYEATITWLRSKQGSSPLGVYKIECTNCPVGEYKFPVNTTKLSIIVNNFGAYAKYSLKITNENLVTELTGKRLSTEFTFRTTEGAPGVVSRVQHITNTDGSVTFTWDPPFDQGAPNPIYIVKYGDKELRLTNNNRKFTIDTDTQTKEYTVTIFTEVKVNGKTYTNKYPYKTKVTVNGGIPLSIALAVAFGIIIFIVIVLVAGFCLWRRRNPAYLQVVRMEDGTVKLPTRFYTGGKLYVDPKTYVNVDDAVHEFAFEIERNELKIGEKIGDGEFAEVHKGIWYRGGKEQEVAVKTLKPNSSKHDRDDFLSEAAILGQFTDPNVIFLEGVILQDTPNAIILELMVHGALDKYLQDNDNQFTVEQLLEMARGVASGMKYLSEMGFIHRDLAARNILVDKHNVCKIADFGMSLEIKVDDSVKTKGGKIPVRWTAPEAIQFKKFTTASDVWSYGVVLWEIMSYGERPYWDWGNYEVLEKINTGYRLPPPMSCPRVVHDLMLNCWNKERTKRPLFSEIRDKIDSWLRTPELLEDLAPIVKLDENLDYTIMQTINKWLEAIGMGRYAKNFVEQGFATPRQILLLTMDDLEALGVGPMEHKRKIYKAIENTKTQVEAQIGRSNSVISRASTGEAPKPHNI